MEKLFKKVKTAFPKAFVQAEKNYVSFTFGGGLYYQLRVQKDKVRMMATNYPNKAKIGECLKLIKKHNIEGQDINGTEIIFEVGARNPEIFTLRIEMPYSSGQLEKDSFNNGVVDSCAKFHDILLPLVNHFMKEPVSDLYSLMGGIKNAAPTKNEVAKPTPKKSESPSSSLQQQIANKIVARFTDAEVKKIDKDNYLDIHLPSVHPKRGTHLGINTAKELIKIVFYCREEQFNEQVLANSKKIEAYGQGLRIKDNPTFTTVEKAVEAAIDFVLELKRASGNESKVTKAASTQTESKKPVLKEAVRKSPKEGSDFEEMIKAYKKGDLEKVAEFIEKGNPPLQFNMDESVIENELIAVCAAGEVDLDMLNKIIKRGDDLNARNIDEDKYTAVHYCAWDGKVQALALLLRNGASPDIVGGDGRTALHLATAMNHAEAVEMLLKAGVDIDRRIPDGTKYYSKKGATALREALINQRWEIVDLLLGAEAEITSLTEPCVEDYKGKKDLFDVIRLLAEDGEYSEGNFDEDKLNELESRVKGEVVTYEEEKDEEVEEDNEDNEHGEKGLPQLKFTLQYLMATEDIQDVVRAYFKKWQKPSILYAFRSGITALYPEFVEELLSDDVCPVFTKDQIEIIYNRIKYDKVIPILNDAPGDIFVSSGGRVWWIVPLCIIGEKLATMIYVDKDGIWALGRNEGSDVEFKLIFSWDQLNQIDFEYAADDDPNICRMSLHLNNGDILTFDEFVSESEEEDHGSYLRIIEAIWEARRETIEASRGKSVWSEGEGGETFKLYGHPSELYKKEEEEEELEEEKVELEESDEEEQAGDIEEDNEDNEKGFPVISYRKPSEDLNDIFNAYFKQWQKPSIVYAWRAGITAYVPEFVEELVSDNVCPVFTNEQIDAVYNKIYNDKVIPVLDYTPAELLNHTKRVWWIVPFCIWREDIASMVFVDKNGFYAPLEKEGELEFQMIFPWDKVDQLDFEYAVDGDPNVCRLTLHQENGGYLTFDEFVSESEEDDHGSYLRVIEAIWEARRETIEASRGKSIWLEGEGGETFKAYELPSELYKEEDEEDEEGEEVEEEEVVAEESDDEESEDEEIEEDENEEENTDEEEYTISFYIGKPYEKQYLRFQEIADNTGILTNDIKVEPNSNERDELWDIVRVFAERIYQIDNENKPNVNELSTLCFYTIVALHWCDIYTTDKRFQTTNGRFRRDTIALALCFYARIDRSYDYYDHVKLQFIMPHMQFSVLLWSINSIVNLGQDNLFGMFTKEQAQHAQQLFTELDKKNKEEGGYGVVSPQKMPDNHPLKAIWQEVFLLFHNVRIPYQFIKSYIAMEMPKRSFIQNLFSGKTRVEPGVNVTLLEFDKQNNVAFLDKQVAHKQFPKDWYFVNDIAFLNIYFAKQTDGTLTDSETQEIQKLVGEWMDESDENKLAALIKEAYLKAKAVFDQDQSRERFAFALENVRRHIYVNKDYDSEETSKQLKLVLKDFLKIAEADGEVKGAEVDLIDIIKNEWGIEW